MRAVAHVGDDEPHGAQSCGAPSSRRPSLAQSIAPEHPVRRRASERSVRPVLEVPDEVTIELALDERDRQRKDDPAEALVLHAEEEALDDGDAAGLPHGSEARSNASLFAPGPILLLEPRGRWSHERIDERMSRSEDAWRERE